MAKQAQKCDVCGGSTDGTPSGIRKHNATSKHALAAATAAKLVERGSAMPGDPALAEIDAALDAADPRELPGLLDGAESLKPSADFTPDRNATILAVQRLAEEKEQELQRRKVDHKWRVAHKSTDVAEAYYSDKVAPLREEIATLWAAAKLLKS